MKGSIVHDSTNFKQLLGYLVFNFLQLLLDVEVGVFIEEPGDGGVDHFASRLIGIL